MGTDQVEEVCRQVGRHYQEYYSSGIFGIFVRNIILLGTDQVEEADRLGDIIRNIMYISSAPAAAAPEDVKSTTNGTWAGTLLRNSKERKKKCQIYERINEKERKNKCRTRRRKKYNQWNLSRNTIHSRLGEKSQIVLNQNIKLLAIFPTIYI